MVTKHPDICSFEINILLFCVIPQRSTGLIGEFKVAVGCLIKMSMNNVSLRL